jgi:hypothetical protein
MMWLRFLCHILLLHGTSSEVLVRLFHPNVNKREVEGRGDNSLVRNVPSLFLFSCVLLTSEEKAETALAPKNPQFLQCQISDWSLY